MPWWSEARCATLAGEGASHAEARRLQCAVHRSWVLQAVPELDLVLAACGGSYNDQALFTFQRVYVPEGLLPAVAEPD